MTMHVDEARIRALAAIERSERNYKLAFFGAVVFEALLLGALLLAADFSNRTHVMLFAGFVGSYSVVVLAIVALGAHVSRMGQRILRAIDTIRPS